jgi:hypothetical protein
MEMMPGIQDAIGKISEFGGFGDSKKEEDDEEFDEIIIDKKGK